MSSTDLNENKPMDPATDLTKRMDAQDTMLKEILTALKGDQLGNPGLVSRVGNVEVEVRKRAEAADVLAIKTQVEAHDRKLWLGATLISAVWAVLVAFKEQIFK